MEKKLRIEHLAPYLPYRLKTAYYFNGHKVCESPIVAQMTSNSYASEIPIGAVLDGSGDFKPILKPLSWLTKEIEHNGERFEPACWFEICDEVNDSLEFDFGNVRLIKTLIDIAKYNNHHDINYLPFYVVQKLMEWRFDVFGLIESGLAIEEGGQG